MTDYNNLTGLRHSEQILVERTVRELEQRRERVGYAGEVSVHTATGASRPQIRK